MRVLENLNDNSFLLDSVPYTKVYQLKKDLSEDVSLVNIYDSSDVLFRDVNYNNIQIGEATFESVDDLLLAFEDLKANFNSGGAAPGTLDETPTSGSTNGVESGGVFTSLESKADLVGGIVPQAQLPSYVDDILEYANLAAFPVSGESGKIYVAIDSSKQYRWTGSAYLQITNGLIATSNDVPEGVTNLYFTTARVLATLLTGISFVTGGAIVSTDSVLVAFGKIQKQINDLLATGSRLITTGEITKLSNTSGTNTGDQDLSSYATTSAVNTQVNAVQPGAFDGTFALDKLGGNFYNDLAQSGALTLAVGGSAIVGGGDCVKITANGSAITVPGAWINVGGDSISIVNGAINRITVMKTVSEIWYTVKVN